MLYYLVVKNMKKKKPERDFLSIKNFFMYNSLYTWNKNFQWNQNFLINWDTQKYFSYHIL